MFSPEEFKTQYPSYALVCDIALHEGDKYGVVLHSITYNEPFIELTYSSGVATETDYLEPNAAHITNRGRCEYAITRLLNLDIYTLKPLQETLQMSNVSKETLLEAIAAMVAVIEGAEAPAKAEKKAPAKAKAKAKAPAKKKELSIREKCEALAELYKTENSSKELKAFLTEEFEVKAVAKVDDDDLEDLMELLEGEGVSLDSDDGSDDGSDDVTPESVKIACQAYSKAHGKEQLAEVLEEYDIKTSRGLKGLSNEQLEDLLADLTDD